MLLCICQEKKRKLVFLAEALTPEARELLSLEPDRPIPCPVREIIPSDDVLLRLTECFKTGQKRDGVFTKKDGVQAGFSVTRLGDRLVLNLHSATPTDSEFEQAIGRHHQTADFTGTVVFEAVRNTRGKIEDLRVIYQNRTAIEKPFMGKSAQVGQLISEWYHDAKSIGQFDRFVEVIETGKPFVMEKYYPVFDRTYHTSASKFRDGVIASYYSLTDRVRAEQTVRQQAHLLEQIMNNSYHFIMTWKAIRNKNGVIKNFQPQQYNNAVIRSGLFTEEDFQTKTLLQLSPEAIHFLPIYAKVVDTGAPARLELPFSKGGKKFWFDLTVSKIGEGALSIFRDVTERKTASLKLQEHNQFLESIINSSENAILVSRAVRDKNGAINDFTITNVNHIGQRYARENFGIDIVGQSARKISNNTIELFDEYVKVIETGESFTLEKRYFPNLDKWFKVTVHKLEDGLVFTYIDVTEIQQSLVESQNKNLMVEAVLNGSINGVLAMKPLPDAEGKIHDFEIVLANEAAGQICSMPTEELVSQKYLALFPESKGSGFFDLLQENASRGSSFRVEWSFPDRVMDTTKWFELSLTHAGEELVILTFMDITEEMQLRQKQQNLLQELRLSNRNLEQFAYVASHDLQEPTRKIKSFGDLLLGKHAAALSPDGADIIRRMQSASSRMQELIDGLLSYSRFASQKAPHLQVALQEVLTNILNDFEMTIKEKNAVVILGPLPIVRGDRVQLRQLFQNLISNALKFTDDHTPPHITVEAGTPTPEELFETVGTSNAKWHAIRVIDNGIGFESAYRSRVFELFVRLHGRSQYSGNGLGLAICKRAAELHGGGITVNTAPGRGTTFTVVLPVSR